MQKTMSLALIGENISYSLSKIVQKAIFNELNIPLNYELISFPEKEFCQRITELRKLDGFSVTKPYKQKVLEYLTDCSLSAVNVVKNSGGKLYGYNSDGYGFIKSFITSFAEPKGKRILVLGAGGVSYPICSELVMHGAIVEIFNRTLSSAEKLAKETGASIYRGHPPEVIINCTTLGLNGENSLPSGVDISNLEFAFDAIYTPSETEMLKTARLNGAKTMNGQGMLIFQAIKADEIFLDRKFSEEEILNLYNVALAALKNV